MRELNFLKKILVLPALCGFVLSISGCQKSTQSLEIKPPIEIQWGNAGTQPSAVYTDYDWIIMSRSHYESTLK